MKQKAEKSLTAEQIYKKNQKKSKLFKKLSPVIYWVFIGLAVLFFCLMLRHSIGNVFDILDALDKDIHTGQEISENYAVLVEKWGEWVIIGDSGGASVRFIDIRAALFSGLMITFLSLTIASAIIAVIVGKLVFPRLSQLYKDNNEDMVNLAALQTNSEVQELKKNKKEWF